MTRPSLSHALYGVVGLALVAIACNGDEPPPTGGPFAPADPWLPPASITIVSGDGQHAFAGQQLSSPLVVRITNSRDQGVGSVPVIWTVPVGSGRFAHDGDTLTGWDGLAEMRFEPTALGSNEIQARVISIQGSFDESVRFSAVTDGVQIEINDDFGWGNVGFYAPDDADAVTIPVGTPVEWINLLEDDHSVTSTSVPPGGAEFDSGLLHAYRSFRFVPAVPGTWEYVDEETGIRGTLIATAGA